MVAAADRESGQASGLTAAAASAERRRVRVRAQEFGNCIRGGGGGGEKKGANVLLRSESNRDSSEESLCRRSIIHILKRVYTNTFPVANPAASSPCR